MNNLQHIVKDNTRFAMHMAVELCERGDFDSVNEALRWLMKERDDVATPSGGECGMIPSFTEPTTLNDCQEFCCSACGEYMVLQQFPGCLDDTPNFCPNCGRKAVER